MTNNTTAALTDDEREKLIDLVDRLIRNPDAVSAKDCIIGNDVRTVQWIAEHTRALLTSPRAAVPAPDLYWFGDHEHGFECPDDAAIVHGRKLGERFTLKASWYADMLFEVTKVPDDNDDDYEVRALDAAPAAPVAELVMQPLTDAALREALDDFELVCENNDVRRLTDDEKYVAQEFALSLIHGDPSVAQAVAADGAIPTPEDVQSWAVTVEVNGMTILTISDSHVGGIDSIGDFGDVVRSCAQHLTSFIGKDDAERAAVSPATNPLHEIQKLLREVDPKWHERGEFGVKSLGQILCAIRDLAAAVSPAPTVEGAHTDRVRWALSDVCREAGITSSGRLSEAFARAMRRYFGAAVSPATADAPLNGIAATMFHGEGAIARCSYCGRYSIDPKTLGDRQPKCECGEKHGWSGSFEKPGPDAKWSGEAPATADERAALQSKIDELNSDIRHLYRAYGEACARASQAAAPDDAREPAETEQSIAADCYHWIAERIGTKNGYSVQEHVDAMCQMIDECADFFHDFVGADEGGDDAAVRIAKNIRALKAGTLHDVSAPADAREPDAYVPIHPRNGPLWASTVTSLDADRPKSYPVKPVYLGAPADAGEALTEDDVERQYDSTGIHIGSGLPRATCPCGFCAKHRYGFNLGAQGAQGGKGGEA